MGGFAAADLPRKSFRQRVPLPEAPPPATPPDAGPPAAPAEPAGTTPLAADAAWYNQPPPNALAVGQTHSWIFVPLLHAAVGRLHPDALAAWEAHPNYAPIWQRALRTLRQAPPVDPAALVHALHTLQQLATEEGRAPPVVEAQMLLALAAESNALPHNTLVHLPWAWQLAALPDGYIPATVQEALLHVFMGEREASALLRAVVALARPRPPSPQAGNRRTANAGGAPEQDPPEPSSSSSSSSSSASSSSEAGGGPVARQVHGEFDTLQGPQLRAALASLDPISVEDVLLQPCHVFRTPPAFCKPQLRRALRWVLRLIRDATGPSPAPATLSAPDVERPWTLWLLLPRMLLFRPSGTDRVPKPVVLARFTAFFRGEWEPLLGAALAEARASTGAAPGSHTANDLPRRLERATRLAHAGELSAARQALTAEPLAAPTEATLRELTDPSRRPAEPYRPLPQDLLDAAPNAPIALNRPALLANLRRARRGAAPGPSDYTSEILRLVLDEEEASQLFGEVASILARAQVPQSAIAGLALGRLVAISKPSGGTRGLVVGDALRRLVARTIAQQFAAQFEDLCNPHQHALSTRAGAEALVHTLQARSQADPTLTVLSVDAAAAYDVVSREAMLAALRDAQSVQAVLPFARMWYARESRYVWAAGDRSHCILQAEGGEQGDPLMPAMFSLACGPHCARSSPSSNPENKP